LLKAMDRAEIDRSVLASVATKPSQQHNINLFLSSLRRDRFIPFGAIHPMAPDAGDELDFICGLGFKGIKLHPDYQGFYADDPAVFGVYEKCCEKGLVVLFHAGVDIGLPEPVHATPDRLAAVSRAFPKMKLVCAHFGGWKMWGDVDKYLCSKENVYIDTSFCSKYIDTASAKKIITAAPGRVMLGSDCPWEDPSDSVSFIHSLKLDAKTEKNILGENARKLLDM
ncbi:MAG TPA: amidohydrolase family protein, partial [Bacillota bacterium]|nr:amidohydrolase family protein [Bacillota bacterium]